MQRYALCTFASVFVTLIALLAIAALLPGMVSFAQAAEPSQDYLVLLDLGSPDTPVPLEEQVSYTFDRFFPRLMALQEQGLLDGFAPIPEAGALLLQAPQPAALTEIAAWADVASVTQADAPAMQTADTRMQAARVAQTELQHARPPTAEHTPSAPQDTVGVGGLWGLDVYEAENYVTGYVYTKSVTITVTLKDGGGAVKSQATTIADEWGDFRAYFTDTILGGDEVVVQLAGEPPVSVDVVSLSVAPDKATNIVYGVSPANEWVHVVLYSRFEDEWY